MGVANYRWHNTVPFPRDTYSMSAPFFAPADPAAVKHVSRHEPADERVGEPAREQRDKQQRGEQEADPALDLVSDLVLRVDESLCITYANLAVRRAWRAGEAALPQPLSTAPWVPEDLRPVLYRRCQEAASRGREVPFAIEHEDERRERHRYHAIVLPVPAQGVLLCVLRDLSEITDAEHALLRAQLSSRMKDEFLATLSHELRTPLNAILGWTQTLQRTDVPRETLDRALVQIAQSAQAQARLIDDLLNVSDIVAGRVQVDLQPMHLARPLYAVIEALRPSMDAKAIRLDTPREETNEVICGDPVRLQQVFWNLLANAVKFTPSGGAISIAIKREGLQASVTITDSGEGIRQEFLPHVFDRFSQADATSRKQHGGLGLGLAIARYLIELHGGTVSATSAGRGMGSEFTVRLPVQDGLAENAVRRAGAATGIPARVTDRPLDKLRILTVDDDQSTRDMLQEALRRAGAEVVTAESVRDALEKFSRFQPHVLVSDIGMPSEDGYDLLRQIRALGASGGGLVPAVALTGFAREQDRALTWRAGYQAMTPKPVNLEELIATIVALAPPVS